MICAKMIGFLAFFYQNVSNVKTTMNRVKKIIAILLLPAGGVSTITVVLKDGKLE